MDCSICRQRRRCGFEKISEQWVVGVGGQQSCGYHGTSQLHVYILIAVILDIILEKFDLVLSSELHGQPAAIPFPLYYPGIGMMVGF